MRWLVRAAALLLVLSCCSCDLQIDRILPRRGSQNGGTKVTIFGEGFSQEGNFQTDPNAPPGITVTMMTDENTYPCRVEKDSTHDRQIHCETKAMKSGKYWVNVTVNGVHVPQERHCRGGYKNYHCSFYVVWYSTPTINYLNVTSGLPKSTVQLRGRIYTDVYGSNAATSSNGLNVRFLRAYMGGMTCEFLRPNSDDLFGLWLDSEKSHHGFVTCMITGTYVGAQNLSYILDGLYGRSLPDKASFKIFTNDKLAMFQTYAEILGVTPSEGSLMGGTPITIQGRYFDETDFPARVLVGGLPCTIQSLTDSQIVCLTAENQNPETGVFPGSRGLKVEMWNETRWKQLSDIWSFNENTTGYQKFWIESMPYKFDVKDDFFSTRTQGFFLPPKTDDYTFYIHCDDRCELYLSNSTKPEFKEKIAFQTKYVSSILSTRYQRSRVITLTANEPVYLEYLQQEYSGLAHINIGVFATKSPFTESQSDDAENEIQQIVGKYDLSDVKQQILFDSWTSATAVNEQQQISVTSSCTAPFCDSTFFVLGYGQARTGPIAVSASATDLEDALNSLWTIKPDTVQVTRQARSQGADFTVTFNSARGDYDLLSSTVFSSDPVIVVTELTGGQSDMTTFTVVWDGVPSQPIAYNAEASEVKQALMGMMTGECPGEILSTEGSTVKFFNDYEGDNAQFNSPEKGTPAKNRGFCGRWSLKNAEMLFMESYFSGSATAYGPISIDQFSMLCFAYKGSLKNEIGIKFTYKDLAGDMVDKTEQFSTVFNSGSKWSYKCTDMAGFLQGAFVGSEHTIKEIHLYKDSSGGDFYVDAVHIGNRPTTYHANGIPDKRKPPPFEDKGISFDTLEVTKQTPGASQVLYEVDAMALDCGYGFPMMQIGFMQEMEQTEDMASFNTGEASVNITYVNMASPPLKGTFDIEFAGGRAEGVPVDIGEEDLKYTLEGIQNMGDVTVKWKGTCREPLWQVYWVTNPGKQTLMQIDSSNVIGTNAEVFAKVKRQGGMFQRALPGDYFRTMENKPQVEVLINKIPSKCTGDCGYMWSEDKTPHVTGITPSQGSNGLGTLLTVTGTGFSNESAIIMVGESECVVEDIQDGVQICRLGRSRAGTHQVSVNFPSLGYTRYAGGESFSFTYQLIVSSISPTSGSLAGGTLLTVEGFGFSENTTVTVGTEECVVVESSDLTFICRTPAGSAGTETVRVTEGTMTEVASSSFTYDTAKTPHITSMSPQTATLVGEQVLTIGGSNLGAHESGSAVLVGMKKCVVSQWTPTNIACALPLLPPGRHRVDVQVGNNGFGLISDGVNASITYIFKVTGVSPRVGSLYGGTTLTITGSGFSENITDNEVFIGGVECEVTAASEEELQCVTKPDWKRVVVTNQGAHPEYGPGYAWQPSGVQLCVGDTVEWQWKAAGMMNSLYRVFTVAQPSSTVYDNKAFSSGDAGTVQGKYRYQFTVPKTYFISSGYVDKEEKRKLQGVYVVKPCEDEQLPVSVSLRGMTAEHRPGDPTGAPADACIASSECQQPEAPSGNFNFSMTRCASPVVRSISPNQGTYHQVIHISGDYFTDTACAITVTVGDEPCQVINSTSTDIFCQLNANTGLSVALMFPVAVRVNNRGSALIAIAKELDRHFVLLPVIDSISPAIGSSTGHTRVTVHGSGFSQGLVTLASEPCRVVNVTYTEIICDTLPSLPKTGNAHVHTGRIAASCHSDCSFTFSTSVTPTISGVSPSSITEPTTTITISGAGFGEEEDEVAVLIDSEEQDVLTVTDDEITAQITDLPVGLHPVGVIVRTKGLASGDGTVDVVADADMTPGVGSLEGGTRLTITGNGFVPGKTAVTIDGQACEIQDISPRKVNCLTPPHAEGSIDVDIEVLSVTFPSLTFTYSANYTPVVNSITPVNGSIDTIITLLGSGFGSDPELVSVLMNDVACSVTSISDEEIVCTAGQNPGGTYKVVVNHHIKGSAESEVEFHYDLALGSVHPDEGSFAGNALVSVSGSGFDPLNSTVKVCGKECEVFRQMSTSTLIYCRTPAFNDSASELRCEVTVETQLDSVSIPNAYTYRAELTPVISEVSPRRGGTAGGTTLTISGSGFSTDVEDVNVTIAGSVCDIQSTNTTHIICVTNAQPRSQETQVVVSIKGQGDAKQESADFFYVDVWSSRFTWGGLSPPEEGSFVVITEGQTILLDVSTPVLKMLLIQGGTLVFDETDIELQAENILIVGGGHLIVGTEEQPFQHQATITLHGAVRAPELPVYGAKTLAIREGTLDLHGKPVPQTWTRLAATAAEGATTITLEKKVTWKANDKIVIATTGHRHSQKENEVKTIASVSADGLTLTLTEPLTYEHLGVRVTLPDGAVFDARAEVGLLTRNVKVQGSINAEWSDKIEACEEGFDTGEFATQTCFQGRFGEEMGSDQFGACIMFHAPRPNENLAIGRIGYIEVYNAGQAFRLGRYPIHWHLMGDVNYKSYVRGCSLWKTFNRAVTIHNTHQLLVEFNVIYDIMGGAFFIEDGIETGNIVQYNLAVFVKQSTSLLNDDVTPAAYWVTNPNNIIRHNHAAGGTHFGFWYRMHLHPDGPSYTPNVCQKKVPLGEFNNNTVHSQGWFGIWIFQDFFPMKGGSCRSTIPEPAVFNALTTWNCEKGAEWVNVGAVQFHNFTMVNNEKAGIEAKRIFQNSVSGFGIEEAGALVKDSTIVAYLDELKLGEDYCTKRGVIVPFDDGMSVLDTRFVNFNRGSCTALGVTTVGGVCLELCGGWGSRYSGIEYFNSTQKGGFRWEHEAFFVDLDGSLTGNVDHKVVPWTGLLDPAHCTKSPEWSVGFPGAICDHTVEFSRFAFNNPSPSSLEGQNAILYNDFGFSSVPFMKKRLTHKLGWMALLPMGQNGMYFENGGQITNISYSGKFYGFKSHQALIMKHNFTQSPDRFQIIDKRDESPFPLTFSNNSNGDWYFDSEAKDLYYMISGKDSMRRRRASVDRSMSDVAVNFKVFRCFHLDCVAPTAPPPATLAPVPTQRPEDFILWSDEDFWKGSAANNFSVPTEDSDVVIPSGVWMVLDSSPPALNKLTIIGVLEIPYTLDFLSSSRVARSTPEYTNFTIEATYISIQGGRMIAGWEDEWFRGNLKIILRGDHSTSDWPLPNGPNQGSKVLGVFGQLQLYGLPPSVYRTKLSWTAEAGSRTLNLVDSVSWQVGDQVAISTTSFNVWETETRTISEVSADGLTLTLDQPLDYTHIGENHTIEDTGITYTLAADVGHLTRKIQIIGQDYPEMTAQSFGARLLVGTYSWAGIDYKGEAIIKNVEFYRSGQEGWSDSSDPRYSVAFWNLGAVTEDSSILQGCSFHHGFSPAIGVFGTHHINIDDNVVHHTVGEGIRIWGDHVKVRRNLVMLTLWPGSYQDRKERFNMEWNAAIEATEGDHVVLQYNIVTGYQRVGYRFNGEPCPGSQNDDEVWMKNEAHGGLYGVYMNADGLPSCSHIRDFVIWRSYDFGIYFQTNMNIIISDVTLVDNGMGIFSIIYRPPSLLHQYADKSVEIHRALIVGSSPDFNCTDTTPSSDYNLAGSDDHRAPRPPQGGKSGICWPTFASGHNRAPEMAMSGLMNYPAIKGVMIVNDTVFAGFKNVCSSEMDFMFMGNPSNDDFQHPVQVSNLRVYDSVEDAKVLVQRADLGKINPSDCVDMECDAKKKSLLKDLDGSFLGEVGDVVPESEYAWGGDPRRGLGDFRIPTAMLTNPDGSRIPVEQIAPNKGILREDCTYMPSWQSYKCVGLSYRILLIESLDSDTETRRLSPVAVLSGGFVDLINGPQDHGWCAGYTCQLRLSTFQSMVASGREFSVFFSSVSPQKIRLMMLNADPSESVVMSIFMPTSQQLVVYVGNQLVAPTNALWNEDESDYTLAQGLQALYHPQMNASSGTNYYNAEYQMLSVLVRGSEPVEIKTLPKLVISFDMPPMTEDEFFGDQLINNLATFLKIPPSKIRITNVIREDSNRRRRRKRAAGMTVEVEIKNPPEQTTSNSTDDEEAFKELKSLGDSLGQAALNDELSESIGFNVSSVGMLPPPSPPSDPDWQKEAEVEPTREKQVVQRLAPVAALMMMQEPVGEYVGVLVQQPSVMAVDDEGNCVAVGVTQLTVTASLSDASGQPLDSLDGNATILFSGCWANYTNLAVAEDGENMTMTFTLNKWSAVSRAFNAKNLPTTTLRPTAESTSGRPSTDGKETTEGGDTTSPEFTTDAPVTEDNSLFGTGTTVLPGSLCMVSVIYSVACCSGGAPIC
ncbi:PKHD1 like 1, tandem duplicate 1 [Neosynchiropus ocellatus]